MIRSRRLELQHLELVMLLLGIALRIADGFTYPVEQGYDFPFHWRYVRYIVEHGALPPLDLNVSTYHHPLWFLSAALSVHLGASEQALAFLSAAFGSLRLLSLWIGFRWLLPERPVARVVALTAAAFWPTSVHLDAMAQPEALSNLWSALAMLLFIAIGRSETRRLEVEQRSGGRIRLWIALGIVLGMGFLTKVSIIVVAAALSCAVLVDSIRRLRPGVLPVRPRCLSALGLAVALGLAALIGAPQWVRNLKETGQLLPTAFELYQKDQMARHVSVSYLDRRSLGFFVGWTNDIYEKPYAPTANNPPRFWPVLVASTFSDYYNFAFSPPPKAEREPDPRFNGRSGPRKNAVRLSIASVVGGTVVLGMTIVGWLFAFRWAWRRRDFTVLGLLFVPLLALLGQLHFATKYPIDALGVIKGAYLQFAAPPLFAVYGASIAWLLRHRLGRALGYLGLAALAPIVAYTLYARALAPFVDV
ncbi:MAG: glycosyltransferase family 39 protein [Deltaproteobacteria bacterium]|nr:glycosyltransferase family 39 protein [Deltaproteobacteria bacterium]